MISNMREKTGKSFEEWQMILKQKAFAKHGEAMTFLKEEHGVSHGFANTIILLSKNNTPAATELVEAQYSGKEVLKPMYLQLVSMMTSFGDDVSVVPKKDSVSLVRKKQFALIKPATKNRIDIGIKLRNTPVGERLGNSGPFGTMCTHRVQLHSMEEIDAELKTWLYNAYQEAD